MNNNIQYGIDDSSYIAAGKYEGIRQLVECFYTYMDTLPLAKTIRKMHPEDLSESIEKLTYFLCGWLGGPRFYQQKYGPIHIPKAHGKLNIGEAERDAWMHCMEKAVMEQSYPNKFKTYLLKQLYIPAERIRMICQKNI